MQASKCANVSSNQLFAAALLATLIATATPVSAGESATSQPTATPSAQVHWGGVFTGEYVNGAPVYRLPSVTVTASRKVELAKIAQEDELARAKTARRKVSTQGSAPTTDKATMALNARYE